MSHSTTAAPKKRLSLTSLPSFIFRPKKYVRFSPTPATGAAETAAQIRPLTSPPLRTAANSTSQLHRTLLLLMELDPEPLQSHIDACNCCRRARTYKYDAEELDRVHKAQLRTLSTELCHVQHRVLDLCNAIRVAGSALISQADAVEERMEAELTERMEEAAELAEVDLIVERVPVE